MEKFNYKKNLFILYFIYTIGYIITYLVQNKVLHFENWIFLICIIFYFYSITISYLNESLEKIKLLGLFLILAFVFKGSLVGIHKIILIFLNLAKSFDWRSFIFIILSILYGVLRIKTEEKNHFKETEELYDERIEDKTYILNFIERNNSDIHTLGIDNNFGFGKTFLIDKIIQELDKDKFEVIKIRCLLLENNEVYPYITKLLSRILIKNLILVGYFEKIKNSLIKSIDFKFFGGISNLFIRETSVDDIENFKKAVQSLKKTIVLIFDDLDRTKDSNKIEKILSFISDFSENNIKTIVLFNSYNLSAIDTKYTRNYLEKYIPIVRQLTDISFINLLNKELEKRDLDTKEFNFINILLNLEKNYFLERDQKLKFLHDFITLVELIPQLSINNITPRNIKLIIDEIKTYFTHSDLKLERKIIIAFVFLKYILYDEFYEVIDNESAFEKLFPIKLKLLDLDIILTLTELDLLKKICLEDEENLFLEDNPKYFDIGKTRIFYDCNNSDGENHLNKYLDKLKISKLENYSVDEVKSKIIEVEKILKNHKLQIMEDSRKNIVIYMLLDYLLLFSNNENKSFENNEKIERAIRKLKFIGKSEYLSSYQRYYDKLKNILAGNDFKECNEKYDALLKEYYLNSNSFEAVFLFGETYEEKTMKILDVFDDEKNKEKYLKLIYYNAENKINDEYLLGFFNGNIQNIKISDFIINEIIEGNYSIKDRNTLTLIRKKISLIIKREKFPYTVNNRDSISNEKYFKDYINYLKNLITEGQYHYKKITSESEVIKKSIEKDIKFLEILLELEKNPQIIPKHSFNISFETEGLIKRENLKKLSTKEEKIKEIEKLYKEGSDIFSTERMYKKVIK